MAATLPAAQKRYLRSLAHPLKPVLQVGAKGVTDGVLAELEATLEHHELLKVKIAAEDRDTRDAWITDLVERSGVVLVQRIGNTAVIYRRHPENPQIVLPR